MENRATLTSISSPLYFSLIQAEKFDTDSELQTSRGWKIKFSDDNPSSDRTFESASKPLCRSRAVRTTVNPFNDICFTISNPIPLLAPVTTARVSLFQTLQNNKNGRIINGTLQIRGSRISENQRGGENLEKAIANPILLPKVQETLLHTHMYNSICMHSCIIVYMYICMDGWMDE